MFAHACEVIRNKYSESSNPEMFKVLSIIRSPLVRDAIIAFLKVRALHGHKQYWIPKLALQLHPTPLLNLLLSIDRIQHPDDINSLADQPLTKSLSGICMQISDILLCQLLYTPYEKLFEGEEDLVIYVEPSKSGNSVYRKVNTCKGLWFAIHNQCLYENIRLLEARHPEVFFLIRYTLFKVNE